MAGTTALHIRTRSMKQLNCLGRRSVEAVLGSSPIDVTEIGEAEELTGEAWLGNTADAKIVNGEEAAAKDAVARKARQRRLRH